jgi:hypothetical protein
MRALFLYLTPGARDNRYVKGKRLHDPQDITCIKLDQTLQSVLRIDSFKVSEFASVLDNALEIAPSLPVRIRHRLSLTSAELKPTVVDVAISVASERALVIRDFSKNLQQVDAKLEEIMQQVSRLSACLASSVCLLPTSASVTMYTFLFLLGSASVLCTWAGERLALEDAANSSD